MSGDLNWAADTIAQAADRLVNAIDELRRDAHQLTTGEQAAKERRERISVAALVAVGDLDTQRLQGDPDAIADFAIQIADALIRRLDRPKEPTE